MTRTGNETVGRVNRTVQRPGRIAEPAVGRRSLLIFASAAGLALAGCTDSPLIPGPDKPSTSQPTPLPGTVEAAATEKELAGYADALLARHQQKLDDDEQELIEQLRDAHLAHLAVLNSPTPFDLPRPTASGSATPPPSPGATPTGPASASSASSASPASSGPATPTVPIPGSAPKAIKELASLEAAASKAHRARALDPTGPEDQLALLTLLWGSLSAATDSYRHALGDGRDPAAEPAGQQRVAMALPSATDAATDLLEQCYAIIFGYQAALAELSGGRADRARSTLSGYRDLRDRLVNELTEDDHDLPAPHAGYKLPFQPTTSARAAKLIGTMETAMQPFLGQWLATTKDRKAALAVMIDNARDALAWTSAITVWPGWPSQP